VDAFLARCFGFCAVSGRAIAGWCLSEYNQPGRCEVGIATVPAFRRQGIATALTGALVEHALGQGITAIGWHCFASNAPSVATAEKAGFARRREYDVYYLRGGG
jgi:RimJ/RimL family protein N-acetyltransferase